MNKIFKKYLIVFLTTMFFLSLLIINFTSFAKVEDNKLLTEENFSQPESYKKILTDAQDYSMMYNNGDIKDSSLNYQATDDNIYNLISKYQIIKDGLNDGDKLFDITFNSKKSTPTDRFGGQWGIMFCMKNKTDSITSKNVASFLIDETKTSFNIGDGEKVVKQEPTFMAEGKKDEIDVYTRNLDMKFRIVGFADGKINIYRDYKYDEKNKASIKDLFATYKVADLSGYFGFSSYDLEEKSDITIIMNGIDLQANVNITDGGINFSQGLINVSDEVKLSAKYYTMPSVVIDSSCNYKLMQGQENAKIEDDVLIALNCGDITFRATSKISENCYKDFTITVTNYDKIDYNYKTNFNGVQNLLEGQNLGDWTLNDLAKENVTINETLCFNNSYNAGGITPNMIFNVPFYVNNKKDVIFDTTFTIYSSNTNDSYKFGFMFGLKDKTQMYNSKGVGSLVINSKSAGIYNGGVYVKPNYVTEHVNDNDSYGSDTFGSYASELSPLTIRIVAKNDGTIELYRGIYYANLGSNILISTSVNNLFATYSGFDLNGYVGFFTANDEKFDEKGCKIYIDDLSIEGNFINIDNNVEILSVGVDANSTFNLMHTVQPISLDFFVVAKPNIYLYKDFTVSVIKGNATIDEKNRIVTKNAGNLTIRITSDYDKTKYKDIDLVIGELNISKLTFNKENFTNVTTDSQAMLLKSVLSANTYLQKYLKINYEIIEGNVEIIDDYLYIKGAGAVKIKAYSYYNPDIYEIAEFNVSDSDLQYKLINNYKGCKNSTNNLEVTILLLASFTIFSLVKIYKK